MRINHNFLGYPHYIWQTAKTVNHDGGSIVLCGKIDSNQVDGAQIHDCPRKKKLLKAAKKRQTGVVIHLNKDNNYEDTDRGRVE